MKTIGVTANCGKERAADVLGKVVRKARALGLRVLADKDTARLAGLRQATPLDEIFERADAVMALGGDGTVLRVARELAGRDKPVMGVNIGGLGFLTSVSEDEIGRALHAIASDKYVVSLRTVAEGAVERRGRRLARYRALNDIVMLHGSSSRVVTLDVKIDGRSVTSYVCDGLIVSTPTGSTGHSLSAGGPIVTPDTSAFVLSLICPHTLSSRPLVAPDRSEICVAVASCDDELTLSVDGQVGQSLKQGDCLKVKRGANRVRFLHLPGHCYFSVLRQKLHWRGSAAL